MADQGKWFKLWESALDDFDLENLGIHEWYCWARFGVYMKKHGREGKIRLRAPATALTNLFRVSTFDEALQMIKQFPNYTVGDADSTVTSVTSLNVTYQVECVNWWKYQGDFSGDRVRKWRAEKRHRVTIQEEKRSRRDVEEKRTEKKKSVSPPPEASQEPQEGPYKMPLPETDALGALIVAYKLLKGFTYDDRKWDRDNWSRATAKAKLILDTFDGNFRKAVKFMESKAEEFKRTNKTDWRIDWIVADAHEWKLKLGGTNGPNEPGNRESFSRAVVEARAKERSEKDRGFLSAGQVLGSLGHHKAPATDREGRDKT